MNIFPDEDEADGFDFEPSEHEPEEVNPEDDLYDPNTDSLTIPQVETDPSEAHPAVRKNFWAIVVLIKFAVLTAPLGITLIVFESNFDWGLPLVIIGGFLAASALYRYVTFDPSSVHGDSDGDGDSADPGSDATDRDEHVDYGDTAATDESPASNVAGDEAAADP